ncbi:MAG TPA: serine/threonine-protein kinase [Polyangiaceae bacterium]|jgi:serine/threonine-protein kinase|nr:serine/threonine-protein kinase [Polyangiaceae bacterium]
MPAPTRDPSLAGLPRQLGKYTLVRRLATGGMAELFLAIQRSVGGFEKLIVIKRILPAMNHDDGFIQMFQHEARVAAALSHPNLVHVFDLGFVDGAYFIAMEHVHGEDLRSIVRQMKRRDATEFPLEHALSIVLGVCAGLAYAHEKCDLDGSALDIVHRDVSPQNVVVTFNGDVKLVDFGIAKSVTRSGDDTASGRLKGKVPYMSPEQARGEPLDGRSDVFAAGVILFELTTGRRLFKAASEYETLKLICDRDYPLPSRICEGYPSGLEPIVMRALAKDRAARWQGARELQGALEEFVRENRVAASRTALSRFMRSHFEEKLLSHSEALSQEKQLADSIVADALESGAVESGRMSSFGPTTAARTVTDARITGRPGRGVKVLGGLGLLAVVAAATGAVLSSSHLRPSQAKGEPTVVTALATPVRPARPHGVVAIASAPPGASIFVNGELAAQTTPATFGNFSLGTPYAITVAAPGFDEVTLPVTLTADDPSGAVSVVLDRRRPARHKR